MLTKPFERSSEASSRERIGDARGRVRPRARKSASSSSFTSGIVTISLIAQADQPLAQAVLGFGDAAGAPQAASTAAAAAGNLSKP